MTTRVARRSMPLLLGLGLCLLAAHEIRAAAPIKVPMTADRWQATDNAEYVKYKGLDALHLKEGFAVLKDVTFRNGTIEFDVDPQGRMGAGVGFRRRDGDTYEDFYLRPRPNCAQAWDCMQYAPYTRGVLLWDMFPQYQAPAPLREGEWNHVKLVISGRRLHVFINGATSPTLKVGRLEGDTLEGGLLLQGPGYFANLTVAPDAVEGLAAAPEKDPTAVDRRFVRDWQIAPFRELPDGEEPAAITGKSPATTWRPLAAERGGVVNISREYGLPLPRPRRAVAWLKTTIVSDKDQSKRTAIGWSREVWVFVNGRQVFKDANYYQPPAARKTPEGRVSLDNGAFVLPLKKGDNEVTVAVANNFYGWGLILRLEDLEGVRLTRK
jgi:hypothetical protein